MTSRVSWSVDGVEPSVRERAEASARRAGMSLGDWLNSAIGSPDPAAREAHEVAEIHKRLDAIARQVDNISRTSGGPKGDPAVARQLNDAISRLDARLSQISESAPSYNPPHRPASAQRTAPGMSAMDFSIAEIVARQGELDGLPPRAQSSAARMPQSSFVDRAPPIQPQPDYSGLEQQLSHITSQIETLRRPDGIEQSIAAFRGELAEIRHVITKALPRRAIESLEGEIRSLGQRSDQTRSNGIDSTALSGIERALSDIYSELRNLKPAEQLAGFDDAIRNLGGKIDSIVRSSTDPAMVRQLEDAIAALKLIVSNVASNDALNELAGHVQTLSLKVDQLARSGGNGDILSALEQRIAVLTTALEQRDRPAMADTVYFDNAVRTISDRLDNLQVGNDSASSLSHVEQRVHHLLERLEMAETRGGGGGGNLGRVEEGLTDILRHLEAQRMEAQRASSAAMDQGSRTATPADGNLVDTLKRELSDLRFSQSETTKHTQDSLEAVHNTLGHVVDRLAQIEGDLRSARTAPAPAAREVPRDIPAPEPRAPETYAPQPRHPATSFAPVRPEMPNPAAAQAPIARAQTAPATADPSSARALDIAQPSASVEQPAIAPPASVRPPPSPRSPIDPSLPPDHPLEPGTRMQPARSGSTPSERIAASEVVLNEISASAQAPISSTNFIQAARRAAQAAAAAAPPPVAPGSKPNRVTALNEAARTAAKAATNSDTGISSKIRALLVGASVVVIVLGTVKMGMNLLSGHDSANSSLPAESSVTAPAPPAGDNGPRSDAVPAMPSMTSPTPLNRQSMSTQPPIPSMPTAEPAAAPDATGAITTTTQERIAVTIPPASKSKTKAAPVPVADQLPESIGSAALRAAASKGDPGAALEIGVRYAEGKGVTPDYATAAIWYERAAQGGIVPATFRLGTLYEKGLGTKKDLDAARGYYLRAAEKGSAKAMHNLAVLDADGGGLGPNYKSASQWFRKAAERGVADSQFNLGILYARGIGVEQNLAESYKWFSLAAAQGDGDSARKRDDVAKRLDPQSLAAAKLATQTFTAEPQPDEATAIGAPAGGWDAATAAKPAAKSGARPAAKSAAR
ncbi:tetratricopeptide repeat protein [soil metagenome]